MLRASTELVTGVKKQNVKMKSIALIKAPYRCTNNHRFIGRQKTVTQRIICFCFMKQLFIKATRYFKLNFVYCFLGGLYLSRYCAVGVPYRCEAYNLVFQFLTPCCFLQLAHGCILCALLYFQNTQPVTCLFSVQLMIPLYARSL